MLRKFAHRAVVELDFDVRKTLLGDDTNELSLDWTEIDGLNSANHGSDQAELSSSVKEFAIVRVLKVEAG